MVRPPEHVVVEATWGWFWTVEVIAEVGAEMHLAHPLAIKGYENRRVKTEWLDAELLADLLGMGRLPEAWIAPGSIRELRELMADAFTNRVESLRDLLDAFHREIATLDGLIHRMITANDDLRDSYEAIQAIGGVGRVLATVFAAEIGDVHRFPDPRKLGSWAGLTPRHRESDRN